MEVVIGIPGHHTHLPPLFIRELSVVERSLAVFSDIIQDQDPEYYILVEGWR